MTVKYDFDREIDRYHTGSSKWDNAEQLFNVKGILPMWVADMDFRVPDEVADAIKKAADHGIFGYNTVPESYYEALIAWMRRRHGWEIKREWVTMCTGVVPGIRMLIKTFTMPGDQVVVQSPVYYPFFSVVKDNQCEVLDNPLRLAEGRYVMDLADLKAKITPRTRMLLLCSPHNPVSRVWRAEELRALGKLCRENNIMVVSDEIHEDIVFEGFKHVPFPVAAPETLDCSVVCTSGSKTFNLAGLKTSCTIIPDENRRKSYAAAIRSSGLGSPNVFGPVATEAAYHYGESWLEQLLDYLEGNIAFIKEYTEKIPGLKLIQPEGTYLVWLDFRGCGIKPERLGRFAREDARVGLEPGTQFGAKEEGFERMNIACTRRTLTEGLSRLEKAVKLIRER